VEVVDHTWNLSLIFCFDRNTVAAVSHGDDGVLQIIAGTAVDKSGELRMDSISGDLHVSTDLTEAAAGIIADLIFGKDTSADFCGKRCQWFQCLKHSVQRVRERISALASGIGFDTVGIFQQTADGKKFTDSERTSDLQTLQGTAHVFDASERNISLLEKAGECILCLGLHMSDFINICRRFQLRTDFFSHGRRSLVCQHMDDFIIFKCFICFLIHF